jgi:hypothetical protein
MGGLWWEEQGEGRLEIRYLIRLRQDLIASRETLKDPPVSG